MFLSIYKALYVSLQNKDLLFQQMHLPRELQLLTWIDVPYLRDETSWLLYISSHDLLQLLFKGGHYSICILATWTEPWGTSLSATRV